MKSLVKFSLAALATTLSGCSVAQIEGGAPVASRPVVISAGSVAVFERFEDVRGTYTVVEEVFVKDDGESLPRELEGNLRMMAGARGANAIVLAPTNRRLNGTRVDLGLRLDNPFDYFSATAIWIGAGDPPRVKVDL